MMIDWTFESEPTTDGWYSVIVCYDAAAGALSPSPVFWESNKWLPHKKSVVAFSGPFLTEEEAEGWGREHDFT